MVMGGLQKTDKRHQAKPDDLDALISGAALATKIPEKPTAQGADKKAEKEAEEAKNFIFSLTQTVSDDIDDLCLTTTKICRSDVVKAGIKVLLEMPKAERKTLMEKLK